MVFMSWSLVAACSSKGVISSWCTTSQVCMGSDPSGGRDNSQLGKCAWKVVPVEIGATFTVEQLRFVVVPR